MAQLEVACFSAEDAKTALEFGVDRIEFCADYACGGVTPSLADFILLRSNFPEAKIHVMIRPRSGDFHYSDFKIEVMLQQTKEFIKAGANGIVFGALKKDLSIDVENCAKILKLIQSYKNVLSIFHRAIDETYDYEKSLETLTSLGFDGVLSSGKEQSALLGKDLLTKASVLYDGVLEVMPGGGIRSSNIQDLASIGAKWYHSAAWDATKNKLDEVELKCLLDRVRQV